METIPSYRIRWGLVWASVSLGWILGSFFSRFFRLLVFERHPVGMAVSEGWSNLWANGLPTVVMFSVIFACAWLIARLKKQKEKEQPTRT
ncbi:hypothetical protein P4N68_11330 [Corynebacterium felinum]|uniref:Uncharacterized protein n=1 Tax=Corynebacterium felinum TaxID=131318 RepID=A0ABU2B638_9CORY|nr:hypothetical protein [Corynebacterium felinum]MDF5821667.1 hypothetical protein [Corynebacterium felinum]MDR7353741.1 hypothetical protein [Corynebacterium felinum]WJY95920.1 hypothetical protein CFELI_11690 [Corynebacterium felinum]